MLSCVESCGGFVLDVLLREGGEPSLPRVSNAKDSRLSLLRRPHPKMSWMMKMISLCVSGNRTRTFKGVVDGTVLRKVVGEKQRLPLTTEMGQSLREEEEHRPAYEKGQRQIPDEQSLREEQLRQERLALTKFKRRFWGECLSEHLEAKLEITAVPVVDIEKKKRRRLAEEEQRLCVEEPSNTSSQPNPSTSVSVRDGLSAFCTFDLRSTLAKFCRERGYIYSKIHYAINKSLLEKSRRTMSCFTAEDFLWQLLLLIKIKHC